MVSTQERLWHRIRDHLTHWVVGGAVLVATGFAPEEWLARAVEKLHLSQAALHLWWTGLDVRAALAFVGLALIAGDVFWRRRPRPAVSGAVSIGAVPPDRLSIAVLPFANMSGDTSQEFFSDGMTEEITAALSKVSDLRVVGRTSAFQFKGRSEDLRAIGQALGAGHLIDGSVRKAGERLRITAQLIRADSGVHIWAESYDRRLTDIFAIQEEIARAIATALRVPLGLSPGELLVPNRTDNVQAYEQYLRALTHFREARTEDAISILESAVETNPDYAPAWALLGYSYALQSFQPSSTLRTAMHSLSVEKIRPFVQSIWERAERAARKAIELDARSALGFATRARLQFYNGNWSSAIDLFRQALAIDPDDSDVEVGYCVMPAVSLAPNDGLIRATSGILLPSVGHLKQGLEEAGKAYALAPADPAVVALLAFHHAEAGHDLKASKYADAAVDLGYPKDHWPLSPKTLDVRDPDQARTAEVVRLAYGALADPGRRNATLAASARLYPTSGAAAANGATRTDVALCRKSSYYYALLAANNVAYGMFNECLDRRAPGEVRAAMTSNAFADLYIPELRAFRQDPRFQALATRMGLMEYWQQYGPPDDCDLKDGKLTCH